MATATEIIIGFNTEPRSDYQTLIAEGWHDAGSAPSPIKSLDRRRLTRTPEQAEAAAAHAAQMHNDYLATLSKTQKRIFASNARLRNRGLDT